MVSQEIAEFRARLNRDEENLNTRRRFHENYEWLEAFWNKKFPERKFDDFWRTFGAFFWEVDEIKVSSRKFAQSRFVGKSQNPNYAPTQTVINATKFLRYGAGLFDEEELELEEDDTDFSYEWASASGFHALMTIIRQVRNNLFHGSKTEYEPLEQYERNKFLVRTAYDVTQILLDNLVEAERSIED